MKHSIALAASIAICLTVLSNARAEEAPTKPVAEQPTINGRLTMNEGQPVLSLWGTPKERGFAHGYLMAQKIIDGVRHDFEHALKPLGKKYDAIVTKFIVPKFHFEPHEEEELTALFEGMKAAKPKGGLRVDALGRDLGLIDLKALNTFGDWYGLGCSSMAVWGKRTVDELPLIGRNFDFPTFDLVLGHQFIIVHAPREKRAGFVAVTYPGCIGVLTAMNTDGTFASIHDVKNRPQLKDAARPNVPRLLAMRRMMESLTGNDICPRALKMAQSWPTLYGNNIMVAAAKAYGDQAGAGVLEYDSKTEKDKGATLRSLTGESKKSGGCLACTNHHRKRSAIPKAAGFWTPWRYELLTNADRLAKNDGQFTVERMFAHMCEASFPKGGGPLRPITSPQGARRREGFGTLHQVVARCGPKHFHVRLAKLGTNIAKAKVVSYDVLTFVKKSQNINVAAPTR